MVTVGGHSGEVVPLDIIPFFRRELRLIGSRVATTLELKKVMGLVFEGRLKPVIYRTFPYVRHQKPTASWPPGTSLGKSSCSLEGWPSRTRRYILPQGRLSWGRRNGSSRVPPPDIATTNHQPIS